MRKLCYYVAVTIDGFIAAPDGSFDFFPLADDLAEFVTSQLPETVPTHLRTGPVVTASNRRFDTVLMGRDAYRPALDAGITSPYRHLRQYVVSSTLGGIADPEVELVASDSVGLVRRLKREDGLDIWLCGGGKLAGSVLGEIDELIVKRYPLVAGAGIAAFAGEFAPAPFRPSDTRTFSNGTVVTTYTRA